MRNVGTFRRSLIRGRLLNPTPLVSLFHSSLVVKIFSLVVTLGYPSTTLAVLICQCGMWDISCSLFFFPSSSLLFLSLFPFILCSVVLRTPSRITKTNSSLVVSCNLRKTRATINEHETNSVAVPYTHCTVEDEHLILHYRDFKQIRRIIFMTCADSGKSFLSLL